MQTSGTAVRHVFYNLNGPWLRHIVTGKKKAPVAMWLLSCWVVECPGGVVWPASNTAMSSCLNGPGPDWGWETHNGEQRPSRCYKRGGGASSRQQGWCDAKSIICFRANKLTTVCLRLSNLKKEIKKGFTKQLLPALPPFSDLPLFTFSLWSWTQTASTE